MYWRHKFCAVTDTPSRCTTQVVSASPLKTRRNFLLPDPLYKAVQEKAKTEGLTMTFVVIAALREYLQGDGP